MGKITLVCKKCSETFEKYTVRQYCDKCLGLNTTHEYDSYIGDKFGSLTVLEFEKRQGAKQKKIWVRCGCDCGAKKWFMWQNVRKGMSLSCGCRIVEHIKRANRTFSSKAKEKKEKIIKKACENPEYTLQMIGDEYGVTREYVRYVLLRNGEPKRDSRRTVKQLMDENARLRAYITFKGLEVPVFAGSAIAGHDSD